MQTKELTVQERSSEFNAVEGGSTATSAGQMLILAYVLMWAAVFYLVYRSLKSQSVLGARIAKLESTLERLDAQTSAEGK